MTANEPGTGGVDAVPFSAEVIRGDDAVVVCVRGDLDLSSGPLLWKRLNEIIPDTKRLVLDLRDTGFIDSSGLSILVRAFKRLRHSGGDLILRSPRPIVRSRLKLTSLDRIITIEE